MSGPQWAEQGGPGGWSGGSWFCSESNISLGRLFWARRQHSLHCILHWVSFLLEKLQATGYRPRQKEEAADAHPVLALTWSEDMAAGRTQIQKPFLNIETKNKAPCIAKGSLYSFLQPGKRLVRGIVLALSPNNPAVFSGGSLSQAAFSFLYVLHCPPRPSKLNKSNDFISKHPNKKDSSEIFIEQLPKACQSL